MSLTWTNWSGSVECHPQRIALPRSEAELAQTVAQAARDGLKVRVVGTGHSFVPLCATDDVLISLDELQGIEAVNAARGVVTVRAGTKLEHLGAPLREAGFALENQGDIDKQSLAGAVSTGTHGTGKDLGSLSTQVVGVRLVDHSGEVREVSVERDLNQLRAAQLSLGSLGVLSAIYIRPLPAYCLHERLWQIPIEQCLAELDGHIAANRHFEFFWYPATDLAHMKALNPTNERPNELPDRDGERIDYSHRIFPSVRNNKFNECEYAIPAEHGPACFREIRELMRTKHSAVTWPVEYRTVKADDIFLSPAYGRETVTLSIHQANTLPHAEFFADAEVIFRRYQGRPHWGKMHSLTARELRPLYPQWDAFQAVRRQFDPVGRFLNSHLESLFE